MRFVTLLVLLGVAASLTGTAAAAFSSVVQRHAMSRCMATPPGFPRRLSRTGTEITVAWKVFPFNYECVYVMRDGIVRRPPP